MIHKKINNALHVLTYWTPWVITLNPKFYHLCTQGDFTQHLEYFNSSNFTECLICEIFCTGGIKISTKLHLKKGCTCKSIQTRQKGKCKGAAGLRCMFVIANMTERKQPCTMAWSCSCFRKKD